MRKLAWMFFRGWPNYGMAARAFVLKRRVARDYIDWFLAEGKTAEHKSLGI